MTTLDALIRAEAATFFLETVRMAGLVVVAPLPWSAAPARVRTVIVIVLALAAHGYGGTPKELTESVELLAFSVAGEFLLGAAIGFVLRLLVSVTEMVADIVAPQIGLGAAQMFDPSSHQSATALTAIFRNLGLLLVLLAGVHRVLIGSVLVSFKLIPAGGIAGAERSAPVLMAMGAHALNAGVRLALPVMAILFMVQVGLAFISRAAPAMQIFSIGFAVTLAVGILVIVLTLPDFTHEFLAEASHIGTQIEAVLAAFGAVT